MLLLRRAAIELLGQAVVDGSMLAHKRTAVLSVKARDERAPASELCWGCWMHWPESDDEFSTVQGRGEVRRCVRSSECRAPRAPAGPRPARRRGPDLVASRLPIPAGMLILRSYKGLLLRRPGRTASHPLSLRGPSRSARSSRPRNVEHKIYTTPASDGTPYVKRPLARAISAAANGTPWALPSMEVSIEVCASRIRAAPGRWAPLRATAMSVRRQAPAWPRITRIRCARARACRDPCRATAWSPPLWLSTLRCAEACGRARSALRAGRKRRAAAPK